MKSSSPGNVFLFGEHSVVYERPAVIASVNLRTTATISSRKDECVCVKSTHFGEFTHSLKELKETTIGTDTGYSHPLDPLRDVVKRFVSANNVSNGFEIVITSEIPKESGGMSSSTAVVCATLASMNEMFHGNIAKTDFFDWIYPIQVKVHGGKASGAEILSSSVGGLNQVRLNKSSGTATMESKNLGVHQLYVVIGNTNIEASTKSTVPYVRDGWALAKADYEAVFDRIAAIVAEGERALQEGNVTLLGKLMNENHEILARDLGVSHPKLNKLVDVALQAGAYGAKLSGGGKGGIMLALTSQKNQTKIADAIAVAGGTPFLTQIGGPGVL